MKNMKSMYAKIFLLSNLLVLPACAEENKNNVSISNLTSNTSSNKKVMANTNKTIELGTYQQDSSQKEAIEWIILEETSDRMLLISTKIIDSKPWNNTVNGNVNWANSSVHKWLNNDFINSAFSSDEQSKIISVSVDGSNDKVFLLSSEEVRKYFSNNSERRAEVTRYASSQGVYTNGLGNGAWWLRSKGSSATSPAYIASSGENGKNSYDMTKTVIGLRPVIWMKK